jgi:hypothetical protein
MKYKITIAIALAAVLATFNLVQAEEQAEEAFEAPPPLADNVLIPVKVSLGGTEIISQNGSKIKIGFDITSWESVQPNIKFSVQLVKQENGKPTIVDEKVYDEAIILYGSGKIHREIEYTAPSYLNGQYEVAINSQTDKGFPVGTITAGEVSLNGNGQNIQINPDSCYITIQNDSQDTRYTLLQGVDISQNENLIAHCDIVNNFVTEKTITPSFTSYYRNLFGDKMSNQKMEAIFVNPQEKKTISLPIPKVQKPQAYDAVLTFTDNQGTIISNQTVFHYVLQGESATIQNVKLDKKYYQKGESAKIQFLWTPSADTFFGSRGGGTYVRKENLEISITDSQDKRCSDSFRKEIEDINKVGNVSLEIPITKDCLDAKFQFSIKDQSGKMLDESKFQIISKNENAKPVQSEAPDKTKELVKKIIILFVLILFALSMILIIMKRKKTGINAVIFLLVFGGLFIFNSSPVWATHSQTLPAMVVSDVKWPTGKDIPAEDLYKHSFTPATYTNTIYMPRNAFRGTQNPTAASTFPFAPIVYRGESITITTSAIRSGMVCANYGYFTKLTMSVDTATKNAHDTVSDGSTYGSATFTIPSNMKYGLHYIWLRGYVHPDYIWPEGKMNKAEFGDRYIEISVECSDTSWTFDTPRNQVCTYDIDCETSNCGTRRCEKYGTKNCTPPPTAFIDSPPDGSRFIKNTNVPFYGRGEPGGTIVEQEWYRDCPGGDCSGIASTSVYFGCHCIGGTCAANAGNTCEADLSSPLSKSIFGRSFGATGSHIIYYRVKDNVGNWSSFAQKTIIIDNPQYKLTLIVKGKGKITTATGNCSCTNSDPDSTMICNSSTNPGCLFSATQNFTATAARTDAAYNFSKWEADAAAWGCSVADVGGSCPSRTLDSSNPDDTIEANFGCTHQDAWCNNSAENFCKNQTFPDNCGNYVCTGGRDCTGWTEEGRK